MPRTPRKERNKRKKPENQRSRVIFSLLGLADFSLPLCGGGFGWGDTPPGLPCLDTSYQPPSTRGRRFCPVALILSLASWRFIGTGSLGTTAPAIVPLPS